MTEVVIMTPAQIVRFTANGVRTAEDVAMLDIETLMEIPLDTMSAMTKMRLKTLKSWIDSMYDELVGQPSGTLDISMFNEDICRELQHKLSRKGGASVSGSRLYSRT